MKIDVLCNDGSPLGVSTSDIYGESGRVGVGGAELALLTLCEAWHNKGYHVTLYNNPRPDGHSPFPQAKINDFNPYEDRDILIIFRSPNTKALHAKGKRIWWSTDQYTVGNFAQFATKVNSIVTISQFHDFHFQQAYQIHGTHVIDLPVRMWDYTEQVDKVHNRLIYCSVPDRGLELLAQAYPYILQAVPDVTLSITSDYRLWGVPEARNENYIRRFFGMQGVFFLGAIGRREMVRQQQMAQVQAYPCIYDELFCYAVAECQVAGTYPVATNKGALATTNMGIQHPYSQISQRWVKQYAELVVETLKNKELPSLQKEVQDKAVARFSIEHILAEWDKVFNG